MTRHRALPLIACTLFVLAAPRAFAVNKDMVELQTQVQDLQAAVSHLQQTNDERMGVLKDLVQQTVDAVNKMSSTVGDLQQQMRQQQEATAGKADQLSGQVSSLNDSVDEVKARLNNLDKALQAIQSQQQSISATLQNMQPAQPGTVPGPDQNTQPGMNQPGGAPPTQPGGGMSSNVPAPQPMASYSKPSPGVPFPTQQGPYAGSRNAQASQPSSAPVADLYRTALDDYMAAKYPIASEEFNQVIQTSSADPLAGNSYYYLGEIDFRLGKYTAAAKDYDHVINDYPANQKIAVSRLHKGQALLLMKDRDGAIAEFRAVIQRFPNTQEASQAHSKLAGMGVPTSAHR